MTNKTALVVLGMHRSGTSSVAGALAMLGAEPPKTLLAPSDDNPRGFWESWEIIQLNDRILQAGESWWNDWRRFDERKISEAARLAFHADIRATLTDEFGDADTIVIKDPRCCRLWSFWEPALEGAGYKALYILPIRSPVEVARSLDARNGFSIAEGLILWLRHVLEAERATRGKPRIISPWTTFMSDWRGEIARMENTLGWRSPPLDGAEAAAVDDFIHPDLRRQRAIGDEDSHSHPWAGEAFGLMLKLAQDDTAETWRELDDLSERFEIASDLYGGALGSILWNAHMSLTREAELSFAQGEVLRTQDQVTSLNASLIDSERIIADQQQALSSLHLQSEASRQRIAQDEDIRELLIAQVSALETAHLDLTDAHRRLRLESAAQNENAESRITALLEAARQAAKDRALIVSKLEATVRDKTTQHELVAKAFDELRILLARQPMRTVWKSLTQTETDRRRD
ncbi:MAG: hypothetical protein ACK4MH_09665 [Brevundimonas sp.]|uniref:sulfotransferase family protein n=1 Tax=Brevundimonas sp. TaxID=1871086 RepID=UPI00391CA67A